MYRRVTLLYRIADSFFRHWPLFAISAAAVATVVAAITLGRPKSYVAQAATQVITDSDITNALGFGQQSYISPAQQNVNRFNNLMRDDLPGGFIDSFLQRAQLDTPITLDPQTRDPRLDKLRKAVSANADSDEVFSINMVWDNPAECERIVKAMQEQFIYEAGQNRQAAAINTANFLDSQIDVYRDRMKTAESALINYKQTHAGQLPDAEESQMQQLGQLQAEMDYLKITQHDSNLRKQYIQQRLAQIQPVNVAEQLYSESPTESQIKQLQAQRNALIADNWLPDSEKVRAVDDEIKNLLKSASQQKETAGKLAPLIPGHVAETLVQNNPEYQDLTGQLTQANIDLQTQASRMQILQGRIKEYEEQIAKLPAAQRLLTERTRDYTILKSQFEDLLHRREAARIKANLDKITATSSLQPLGSVTAASTTGRKKQAIMIAVALLLGLVLATALLLLQEAIDPTYRFAEDAERHLELPVLGSLQDDPALLGDSPRRRPFSGVESSRRSWQAISPQPAYAGAAAASSQTTSPTDEE